MTSEHDLSTGSKRSQGGVPFQENLDLPYSFPPPRGRAMIWALRILLAPLFVGAVYLFAHYPVDKWFLHTQGTVVDAWVAALLVSVFYGFVLLSDGRWVRATSDGVEIRSGTKQYAFAWSDIAGFGHSEKGIEVSDVHGGSHAIELIERKGAAKVVHRVTPMKRLAEDLEHLRLQVKAPKALTSQVRVGRVSLTGAEWVLLAVIALMAVAIATLRTLGVSLV